MALVLVAGTGLLERSYRHLTRVDLGYRPANVLTMDITPREGSYPSVDARRVAYRSLLERRRQLPGVGAAGAAFLPPFEYGVVGFDGGVLLERETLDGPEEAALLAIDREPLDQTRAVWPQFDAGWSSPVARRAHNPKVGGSNPPPATRRLDRPIRTGPSAPAGLAGRSGHTPDRTRGGYASCRGEPAGV